MNRDSPSPSGGGPLMISILARLRPHLNMRWQTRCSGWKWFHMLTVQNKGNSFHTAYSVGSVPVFEFVYVIHANSEDPSERDGIEWCVNASLALRFIVTRATNFAR